MVLDNLSAHGLELVKTVSPASPIEHHPQIEALRSDADNGRPQEYYDPSRTGASSE